MSDEFQPIDHGPRSNESNFGGLDEIGQPLRLGGPAGAPQQRASMAREVLPFVVGIVDSTATLVRVQSLRAQSYGRHLPHLAEVFGLPDPFDRASDVTVFYARDKATGTCVGAARLQTNVVRPLHIEQSLVLPPQFQGQLLAEVTRLVVLPGYAPPVKLALVKALHLFCIANQIGGVVAATRTSLMRQYLYLGFSDLFGDDRLVSIAHPSGQPHRVLFRDTVTSEADSRARSHPDHTFVFRTHHPDIQVFDALLSQSHRALATDPLTGAYSSKAA